MARTTAPSPATQPGRPPWLPWSVFPFTSRFAEIDGKRIHYIDEGSGPALLLVSAGQWSFMFRDVIASPIFGAVNTLTNAAALFTASSYGVGKMMTRTDRRSFLGLWRSVINRHRPRGNLVPDATLARRIAFAAAVAGALDAVFSVIIYVPIAGRYNLKTVLQYIATGLLGRKAFRSGVAGIGTAALGTAIHFALAAGFATAFALTIGRLPRTRVQVVIAGGGYGATVWVLMDAAVLPALGVAHEPFGGGYWWPFLADHALLVGVPIALLTSKATARAGR